MYILPPQEGRLWDVLAEVPEEFVVYGGTALALHLGHRESLDFDFFGNKPLDPAELVPAVFAFSSAQSSRSVSRTPSVALLIAWGVVKHVFFGLPDFPRLSPPLIAPDNGLQVASLLDLAGTKAAVVQMRAEVKDYIDIDALLTYRAIDLPTALGAARAIYGMQFNPQSTLKALCYFGEGNLRRLPQPVKDRLVKAACEVDLAQLPMITASGHSTDHDPGHSR